VLKKINRICKREEIEEVRLSGKMMSTPLFGLIWMNSTSQEATSKQRKFAAVISKKISKKAVERNRARRIIMEAVRLNMDIFPEGFRGLFLVKKSILDKKMEDVEKCLKELFKSTPRRDGSPLL